MGEEAQLIYLLEKLDNRRNILETQKQDVELALADLEHIADDARTVLARIQSGSNKLRTA
jgi:chaperonin cofactor prefoldin